MLQNYLQIMKESLIQKLNLLDQIEKKSQEQSDLLKQDSLNMDGIDQNMNEKEVLIQQVTSMDEGFDKTYDRIKTSLLAEKDTYKKEIKELQDLISRITEKSTSIQALEARNKAEMEHALQKEKKNMQGKKTSMRAARDYYENMNKVQVVPPQFMDSRK